VLGVVTQRCTVKLLQRLGVPPHPEPPPSSTRLGDWYANLLYTRPTQLVLFVSERTLLPVVVPARPVGALLECVAGGLAAVLEGIGVDDVAIATEVGHMREVAVARTASRRVLGSMNDFAFNLGAHPRELSDLTAMALWLARTPCGPIAMESPDRLTRQLFATGSG
jgi:hypothetical protein